MSLFERMGHIEEGTPPCKCGHEQDMHISGWYTCMDHDADGHTCDCEGFDPPKRAAAHTNSPPVE